LLLPATGFAGGVLLSLYASGLDGWPTWLGLAAFTAAALLSRYRAWYIAGACLFLGCLAERLGRPAPDPQIDASPQEILLLEGCVVEPPVFSDGREQFLLELDRDARARVSLYLRDGQPPPALHYGQRVSIEARLRKPRNFGNPGAFDYKGYLARRHVYWTASARTGVLPEVLPGEPCGSRSMAFLYGLRSTVLERIERLFAGNAYAIGLHQALLVGESSKLQRVWADDYRRTGTYHAIVISGLHISIIAAVVVILLRLLPLHANTARLLALIAVWIYAGVCGWQAPVVRAAGGFLLYAICRWHYRRSRILNLLGALALVFLALDPLQVMEGSFQLTFLSVLALGALAAPAADAVTTPWRRGLPGLADTDRDPRLAPKVAQFRLELRLIAQTLRLCLRLPERFSLPVFSIALWAGVLLLETMLVSAAVQLGLTLPMVYFFHRVSLSSLLANPLVTVLLTLAVPVGFLAVLTGWNWIAMISGGLLEAGRRTVEWAASWEPNWRVPDPPLPLAALFLLSLIALALYRRRWLLAPVLALLSVILWHPFEPIRTPGSLELTMIDVGQGDSLLVGSPSGHWMLVDAGGIPVFRANGPKPRLDIGEDVVSPYLFERSIRRLDVVVSTHQDEDHAGGLPAVLDNFRPRELWVGAAPPSPIWSVITAKAARTGTVIRMLRRGDPARLGDLPVQVIGPGREYVPKSKPGNNDSLMLRLQHGSHSFLLTGDVERAGEADALDSLEPTQVLKVAHHGSKTSTSDAVLDRVQPVFALISAGPDNLFRHPHPEVLERLAAHQVRVFRSDQWGLVTIRSDGRRFTVETHRYLYPSSGQRRQQAF
jgi:competence protein ComEC